MCLYLQNETNIFSADLSVLHFATEFALQRKLSSLPNLNYVSADLYSPYAQFKMNVMDVQFEDDSFDVVLCSHVLEHVSDDRKALEELFRVLKPGGWGIIQVPIDPERKTTFEDNRIATSRERERVFGHPDHVRIYGRDWRIRLEDAGFIVDILPYANNFDTGLMKKYGLRDEAIYLCSKPPGI